MLSLLPAGHVPCFFLCVAFLKGLPADIRSDKTSDPLTLALLLDETFQSRVSSASTMNHFSSTPFLGKVCPVLAIHAHPAPPRQAQSSLTPSPCHRCPLPTVVLILLPSAGISVLKVTWPKSANPCAGCLLFSASFPVQFILKGREFTIFTDHKPLTHALFKVALPWSARQQRHLSYLAKFKSSVVHVLRPENLVADALSRPSAAPPSTASALVPLPSSA